MIHVLTAIIATLVVQHKRVPKSILLDAIALWERAAVVNNLSMMLRQGMVLKLLKFVTCRQVPELLAPVMIQYSSSRLLVVTRSTTYDDSICRRHRHRTHTHWYDMRRTRIDANRVALRHGWHHNILHYLAKFRRQVLIQLTHLHSRYGRCLSHISNNYLLVSTMVVHRRGRLLQQHLPLSNS